MRPKLISLVAFAVAAGAAFPLQSPGQVTTRPAGFCTAVAGLPEAVPLAKTSAPRARKLAVTLQCNFEIFSSLLDTGTKVRSVVPNAELAGAVEGNAMTCTRVKLRPTSDGAGCTGRASPGARVRILLQLKKPVCEKPRRRAEIVVSGEFPCGASCPSGGVFYVMKIKTAAGCG